MAGSHNKNSRQNKMKPAGQKNQVHHKSAPAKASVVDRFLQTHSYAWLWLSGLLPIVGLLVIYMCMGIYPFGEKSVGNVDMLQQYVPFYASLKPAVFNGRGLEYASALGMGGSYWGLIGYYLTSPFAWLSLLVPNEYLHDYMAALELLKVGFAGMSFAYFYSRKFRRKDLAVPLLSLCYAMSAFFLTHLCTIIWSDCLVLLPLIVWGLEEMLRGRRPWLYILCLSLAGIFNYYIAFMIGIYLILYTAAFLTTEFHSAGRTVIFKKIGMFAASSMLSAGIAAVILLPSALLVSESGNASDEAVSGFWSMNPLRLIPQLFYHADNLILAGEESPPLIYCSVFVVICLPLFFICKDIPGKIKIAFGGLSGFIALSLTVNRLNYLWHGAHIPNNLPYRFAFLLVFTLLIMAGFVMEHLDSVRAVTVDYVLLGILAAAAVSFFVQGRTNTVMLIGTLALAIGYAVLLVLPAEKKMRHTSAMLAVLVLAAAELISSGVMDWQSLNDESCYVQRSEYISHKRCMSDITEKISQSQHSVSDSDVYRISTLTEISLNDNVMFGHSGMSFFSSTNNGALMNLLDQAGYNCDGRVTYYYKSFTPLMDSVMNVRYVVYKQNVGNPPYLQAAGSSENYYAYRNTLALPRAFAVAEGVTGWNTSQSNPFEVQNDFVRRAVSDSDLTVYQSLALSPDESQTRGAEYVDGRVKINPNGLLVLSAVSQERRHLYGYIGCLGASQIRISVGDRQYRISHKDAYLTDLGWWEPGEEFTVVVAASEKTDGRIYAALLEESALEDGISRMAQSPARFTEYSETRVSCHIEAETGNMLFTSIPYEKGWSASVNGTPTDIVPIGGGLIGIPLTEGHNSVELRYSVRGLSAGIVLSLVSLIAAVWLLFGREISACLRSKTQ
ncbi:MAG: YfhO family protein [Clostridia bacterium]|nr:YfhO family protein [Clostridia bacterium]